MKIRLLITGLWFASLCSGLFSATPEPELEHIRSLALGLETSIGTGYNSEVHKAAWKPQIGLGIGANIHYSPSQKVWLQAGISEQLVSAYRMVEHPYPYVMEMKVSTVINSYRLKAGCEYAFHQLDIYQGFLYAGAALYADVVHDADANKRLRYVNSYENETVNLEDTFSSLVPGVQFSLGTQFDRYRMELRYWEDIKTYYIPTVPTSKLRRSFIGLNGSVMLNIKKY